VKKRSHLFPLALLGILACVGIAAHATYGALYNRVLDKPDLSHVGVEEIPGTNPVQLKITVKAVNDWQEIRAVTATRSGDAMTVLYHLSLASLAKPGIAWHDPYLLTVPDTVDEVRFGHHQAVIWQRRQRN